MSKHIYKITFNNQQEIYEVYAKHVFKGDLYGFVVVEGFLFNETSDILVDPSAEKIKSEFSGVKRAFIPMHEIIRIDQVEKKGIAKISSVSGDKTKDMKVTKLYHPDKGKPEKG